MGFKLNHVSKRGPLGDFQQTAPMHRETWYKIQDSFMLLQNNVVGKDLKFKSFYFFFSCLLDTFPLLMNLSDIDLCWLDIITVKGFLNVTMAC